MDLYEALADNFERVPLYLFGFSRYDPSSGSIFPAVWSAQLAARAEGVGQVAHRNRRGEPVGSEVPEPLWPGTDRP